MLCVIFPKYRAPCVSESDRSALSYHAILIDFTSSVLIETCA
jgi:hypothetical protein